jgi:hypothetical protein
MILFRIDRNSESSDNYLSDEAMQLCATPSQVPQGAGSCHPEGFIAPITFSSRILICWYVIRVEQFVITSQFRVLKSEAEQPVPLLSRARTVYEQVLPWWKKVIPRLWKILKYWVTPPPRIRESCLWYTIFRCVCTYVPITVAARSKHELSSPSQTLGSWVRIPHEEWTFVWVYFVFMVFCV